MFFLKSEVFLFLLNPCKENWEKIRRETVGSTCFTWVKQSFVHDEILSTVCVRCDWYITAGENYYSYSLVHYQYSCNDDRFVFHPHGVVRVEVRLCQHHLIHLIPIADLRTQTHTLYIYMYLPHSHMLSWCLLCQIHSLVTFTGPLFFSSMIVTE